MKVDGDVVGIVIGNQVSVVFGVFVGISGVVSHDVKVSVDDDR